MKFLILLMGLMVLSARRIRITKGLHAFDRKSVLPLCGLLALLIVLRHLDTATAHADWFLKQIFWTHEAVSIFLFMSGYGLTLLAASLLWSPDRGFSRTLLTRSRP